MASTRGNARRAAKAWRALAAKPGDPEALEAYLAALPAVRNGVVVQHDLYVPRAKARRIVRALARAAAMDDKKVPRKLGVKGPQIIGVERRGARKGAKSIVRRFAGKIVYWGDRAARDFHVELDASLGPALAQVRAALLAAGADWAQASPTAGIEFVEAAPGDPVDFRVVRAQQPLGKAYALAFAPDTPARDRVIELFPPFFGRGVSMVGVLRHELGHVLGYLHEVQGATGCGERPAPGATPLTVFDRRSVMRCVFTPEETKRLVLSEQDRKAHAMLYG